MGFQTASAQLFHDFCLDDHVPSDHLLRRIDHFLDLESVRTALKPFYSAIGRPSVDPELMMRMLITGYSFGIRVAVLINRPPQPVFLARDRNHDLIQVPDVAPAWYLAPETASIRGPELQRPPANRLIGDEDTALEQYLIDELQGKPEV